jgi:hypothetical protein
MTRSRRAGLSREPERHQPLYARMLGLKHLTPSGFLCFAFLEGSIVLGILLALAELVSWWGVLVLPLTVALMVKLNDVVAGAVSQPAAAAPRLASPASAARASKVPESGREPSAARTRSEAPPRRGVDAPVAGPALRSAVAPLLTTEANWPPRAGDNISLGHVGTGDPHRPEVHGWAPAQSAMAVDAHWAAGSGSSGPWVDQLDTRLQRERQSAARRYE